MGGQRHAPAALPPWKTRCTLDRRLGGPQDRPGRVRRISLPPGFYPRTVQPIANRYTDWAIPAHICLRRHQIINLLGAPVGLGPALSGNSQICNHNYQPLWLNMPVTGYLFSVRWYGAAGDWLTRDIDKSLANTAAHGGPRNMWVLLDWIPSCGRDFPGTSGPALGPTQTPIKWVLGLSWGLTGQGVALNTHPHILLRLNKEWSYTSTPLLGLHGPKEGRL